MSDPLPTVIIMIAICESSVTLTAAEITYLERLPAPAYAVEPELPCELQAGHAGPHLAVGQSCEGEDGRAVWARWTSPAAREWIAVADTCPAEDTSDPEDLDSELCQLPEGHVGAHSFEMDSPGRDPSPQAARRILELAAQIMQDEQESVARLF